VSFAEGEPKGSPRPRTAGKLGTLNFAVPRSITASPAQRGVATYVVKSRTFYRKCGMLNFNVAPKDRCE